MDWTTVAVIRQSKGAVATLHAEYGRQIDRLHDLVLKWQENAQEWEAYAKRLEAENAALKAQSASPSYA